MSFTKKQQDDRQSRRTCSRRAFLKQTTAAGLTGVLFPALLADCRGDDTAGQGTADGICATDTRLSPQEEAARQAVNYVDQSPNAAQTCANCRFFTQSATDANCGKCDVVSGPIAAAGHCSAWAQV